MRLVFAEPAAEDLDAIVDYIAAESSAAAERVFRAIVSSTELLRDFPRMGRDGRLSGTRELSVKALPYIIVYQVENDTVTILAVFHGARDLPRLLASRRET